MSVQTPVDKNSPLWKAWEAYKANEEYANTRRWALHEQHVDGSLWAAFCEGFRVASPAAPRAPRQNDDDALLLDEVAAELEDNAEREYGHPSQRQKFEREMSATIIPLRDLANRLRAPRAPDAPSDETRTSRIEAVLKRAVEGARMYEAVGQKLTPIETSILDASDLLSPGQVPHIVIRAFGPGVYEDDMLELPTEDGANVVAVHLADTEWLMDVVRDFVADCNPPNVNPRRTSRSQPAAPEVPDGQSATLDGEVRCPTCKRWHSGFNTSDMPRAFCEDCDRTGFGGGSLRARKESGVLPSASPEVGSANALSGNDLGAATEAPDALELLGAAYRHSWSIRHTTLGYVVEDRDGTTLGFATTPITALSEAYALLDGTESKTTGRASKAPVNYATDLCQCNKGDMIMHTHYADAPHSCARGCGCQAWTPATDVEPWAGTRK